MTDTIAAIATARAPAAIGIVRISGPETLAVVDGVFAACSGKSAAALPHRRMVSGNMRTLGLEPRRARLVRADVLEKPPLRQRPAFDLVFLDPPYALHAEESLRMVANLAKTGAVSGDAIVVYEHALSTNADADEAEAACGFALSSRKKYGETAVDILRLADTLG